MKGFFQNPPIESMAKPKKLWFNVKEFAKKSQQHFKYRKFWQTLQAKSMANLRNKIDAMPDERFSVFLGKLENEHESDILMAEDNVNFIRECFHEAKEGEKAQMAGMSSKFGGKPLRAALEKKYGSDSDQVRDFDETAKEFKLKVQIPTWKKVAVDQDVKAALMKKSDAWKLDVWAFRLGAKFLNKCL